VPRIKASAPAKLNLHLRVGEAGPDGFHDVDSLFLALDFGDTLYLETVSGTGAAATEVRMDWRLPDGAKPAADIPQENNIVSKAVSAFRNRTGYDESLRITVEKRIPVGGGLGGGSSNAAAALLALNVLAFDASASSAPALNAGASNCRRVAPDGGLLGVEALAEIGARLGSDVPFFVHGNPAARVGGRGEIVRAVVVPRETAELPVLLVNPGFCADTAEAYRLLDEYRRAETGGGLFAASGEPGTRDCFADFAGPPRNWSFVNDFLPVFTSQGEGSPFYGAGRAYRRIIDDLKELGADFAGLSGSGSTCFGVFPQKTMVKVAKKTLLKRWPYIYETFCLRDGQCYGKIEMGV